MCEEPQTVALCAQVMCINVQRTFESITQQGQCAVYFCRQSDLYVFYFVLCVHFNETTLIILAHNLASGIFDMRTLVKFVSLKI